jgi:hypothetical protein
LQVDCLALFLNPPSVEPCYRQRLSAWLREPGQRVAARLRAAGSELAEVCARSNFDHVLVNDDLDQAYEDLKTLVSQFRPDIVPPRPDARPPAAMPEGGWAERGGGSTGSKRGSVASLGAGRQMRDMKSFGTMRGRGSSSQAAGAEEEQGGGEQAGPRALVLCGPGGAGREALAQQLLAAFPQQLAAPRWLSDRKLGKGRGSGARRPASDAPAPCACM